MSISKEISETCKKQFSTHKATLIQDTERYFAVDWRKENGSGDYYVNYILDKKCGNLIISGDLGDCIATWRCPITPKKIKPFMHEDPGYFLSKIQCATNSYTHYDKDILEDIKSEFEKQGFNAVEYVSENINFDSPDEFWKFIEQEIAVSDHYSYFKPTEELVNLFSDIIPYYRGWVFGCGERIHIRVYLWIIGFEMALEQLGI